MRRSARFVMIGAVAVAALTTGAAPASAAPGSVGTGSMGSGSAALSSEVNNLVYAIIKLISPQYGCDMPQPFCG